MFANLGETFFRTPDFPGFDIMIKYSGAGDVLDAKHFHAFVFG
jgi:hypothetical protein